MVYTGWEPTDDELKTYYDNYPAVNNISPVTLLRYDELLEQFQQFRSTNKILDVGCGAGHFLSRALLKEWGVQGTEYGAKSIEFCRTKGIPVIEGPLEPSNHVLESYDVICSFEVIEHVTDPGGEIDRMLALLRPGGLLYLTTPNFNCLARRIAPSEWNVASYPEHLNYFTPHTLGKLLQKKKLKRSWLTTSGISLQRWMTKHNSSREVRQAAHKAQEGLRDKMETRWYLKTGKWLANTVLNGLELGDSMKAGFIKPGTA